MTAQGLERTVATSSSTLRPSTNQTRSSLSAQTRMTATTSYAKRTGRPAFPHSTRTLRRKRNVCRPHTAQGVCTISTSLWTTRGSLGRTSLVKLARPVLYTTFNMLDRSFGHWRSSGCPRTNMTTIRNNMHLHARRLAAQQL
jgi:hypothetical protein